jgi:hypothetical protein
VPVSVYLSTLTGALWLQQPRGYESKLPWRIDAIAQVADRPPKRFLSCKIGFS